MRVKFNLLEQVLIIILVCFLSACSASKMTRNTHQLKKEGVLRTYEGVASWYGRPFHGRRTASGERYNMYAMTAAHKSLPFGTKLRLTNPDTNQSVVVKVNDRGPFVKNRELDLSFQAAKLLGIYQAGADLLQIEVLKDATTPTTLASLFEPKKILAKVGKAKTNSIPVSESKPIKISKR